MMFSSGDLTPGWGGIITIGVLVAAVIIGLWEGLGWLISHVTIGWK